MHHTHDAFRVDHNKVVEEEVGVYVPDMQARYEYTKHFGKFDFKDLLCRYRSAKRAAERQAQASLFVAKDEPPSVMRTAIRKRRLVQATLVGWKRSSGPSRRRRESLPDRSRCLA